MSPGVGKIRVFNTTSSSNKIFRFPGSEKQKNGDAIPPLLLLTFLQLCSSLPFIFARHLEACPPPVIKLIIPGERLTRYGSQRITIGCKKPIIRTPAQITNSASLATKHLSQGGAKFLDAIKKLSDFKGDTFSQFFPWSTDNSGQISPHAQCPIFNGRRVLLMFKFAHFDIKGLLLNIAKPKPMKCAHLSIFGRLLLLTTIVNQFNEFCMIDCA